MSRYLRPVVPLACVAVLTATLPARAGDWIWGGLTCGLTATDDPLDGPTTRIGEVNAGPFVATDGNGGLSSVAIQCTVQINAPDHGVGGVSRVSPYLPEAAVLADTIGFDAVTGDEVYLCTTLWIWTPKGGIWIDVDDDEITSGDQCALTTILEAP